MIDVQAGNQDIKTRQVFVPNFCGCATTNERIFSPTFFGGSFPHTPASNKLTIPKARLVFYREPGNGLLWKPFRLFDRSIDLIEIFVLRFSFRSLEACLGLNLTKKKYKTCKLLTYIRDYNWSWPIIEFKLFCELVSLNANHSIANLEPMCLIPVSVMGLYWRNFSSAYLTHATLDSLNWSLIFFSWTYKCFKLFLKVKQYGIQV